MFSKETINTIFNKSLDGIYFSHSGNLCYNKVQKVACTSLTAWIQEFDRVSGRYSRQQIQSAQEKIDEINNETFENTLCRLYGANQDNTLPQKDLRIDKRDIFTICNSESVFSFAIVRNPYARAFSAWADKILRDRFSRNSIYFYDFDDYYRPILTIENARWSLETFLESLTLNRGGCLCDNHYAPQKYILRPDILKYDCIAHLENKNVLVEKIRSWLGYEYPSPFYRRKNVNKLQYHQDFLSEKSIALIKKIYHCDFEAFGYNINDIPTVAHVLNTNCIEKKLLLLVEERIRDLSQYRYEHIFLSESLNTLTKEKEASFTQKLKRSYAKRVQCVKKIIPASDYFKR